MSSPFFARLKNRARRKPAQGFTLVEVMVSVAVFALGFIGVLAMMLNSVGATAQSRTMTDAVHLAESAAELMTLRGRYWTGSQPVANEVQELTAPEDTWHAFKSAIPDLQTGEFVDAFMRKKSTLPVALQARAVFCVDFMWQRVVVNEEAQFNVRAAWGKGGYRPASCASATVTAELAASKMSAVIVPVILRRQPR